MSELSAEKLGLHSVGQVYHNLSYDALFDHEVANQEGQVLSNDTMTVDTGKFTGRSPKDKFFVQQEPSNQNIAWGNVNKSVSAEILDDLYADVITYLSDKDIYDAENFDEKIENIMNTSLLQPHVHSNQHIFESLSLKEFFAGIPILLKLKYRLSN